MTIKSFFTENTADDGVRIHSICFALVIATAVLVRVSFLPGIIGTDDAVYMHAGHKISQGVWEVSTYAGSIRFGVNAVIGFYSTSMLTAMAMDKMVIMYLPQNFLKVRFADYFGIQVVRNLEEINWNDNTMKQKRVQKEVLSDVTDVEILDRWLNLSTNKVKDKI